MRNSGLPGIPSGVRPRLLRAGAVSWGLIALLGCQAAPADDALADSAPVVTATRGAEVLGAARQELAAFGLELDSSATQLRLVEREALLAADRFGKSKPVATFRPRAPREVWRPGGLVAGQPGAHVSDLVPRAAANRPIKSMPGCFIASRPRLAIAMQSPPP